MAIPNAVVVVVVAVAVAVVVAADSHESVYTRGWVKPSVFRGNNPLLINQPFSGRPMDWPMFMRL